MRDIWMGGRSPAIAVAVIITAIVIWLTGCDSYGPDSLDCITAKRHIEVFEDCLHEEKCRFSASEYYDYQGWRRNKTAWCKE